MYKLSIPLCALALMAGCSTVISSPEVNTISESQLQYVEKYKKQKCLPKPENMLINTDKEPQLTEGFTPLFNGQDLVGWSPKGGKCTFEVKDDVIVGTCVPGSPSTYLQTDKADYTDFILTCELKWEVDGNTGVMFRSKTRPGEKFENVYGPQCEMEGFGGGFNGRGWSGGIYGQGFSGWEYPLWLDAHQEVRTALKKDDWNRVTILAQGETIKTWLNGVPAAHWKTTEFMKGSLGLQVHAGKEGTILFRNIKVKELK